MSDTCKSVVPVVVRVLDQVLASLDEKHGWTGDFHGAADICRTLGMILGYGLQASARHRRCGEVLVQSVTPLFLESVAGRGREGPNGANADAVLVPKKRMR